MQFTESMFADHVRKLNGSAIREIFHLLAVPGMISFAGGNPAASALEPDVVSRLAAEALNDDGINLLQYGATEGYPAYKKAVCEFVARYGIQAAPADVLPTTGSTQGMDLLCKALVNPGDVVLAEDPTFLGTLQTMRMYNADIKPIATDEYGAVPASIEEQIRRYHPKLVYIIPTFQNPTGISLAVERKKEIAALAEKYGVIVAEDDPYRDLRYSGEALPSIKSFDESGWVVFMGSFSKLVSPGLRTGYVIANPLLLRKMTIGKQSSDVHTCALAQAIVSRYVTEGLLDPHIERISASYKQQLDRMLSLMPLLPEGTKFTKPQGGLFVWAELPERFDTLALLPEVTKHLVAYVPGTHFYIDGGHKNTLRLNFSNAPLAKIDEGMHALAEAFAAADK